MDASELRTRLARDGTVPETAADAIAPAADSRDAAGLLDRKLIAAAVLVPIMHGPDPGILLTKRTSTLSAHPGQVAFPGGRTEPGESAEQTALREALEEVGLPPALVDVTGRLPDHVTGTGFLVTPIVGLMAPGFVPVPAAAEVEAVFTLPLRVVMDPAAPQRRRAALKGRTREFWVWPHETHYIWGATAAILVALARRLRTGEAA